MPTSDSELKKIATAVIEQQPDPYANTYESKEIRTELYKLDKDPTKAKFEAHLKVSNANDVVKQRSGIKRGERVTDHRNVHHSVDGRRKIKPDRAIQTESKSDMQQLMTMVAR